MCGLYGFSYYGDKPVKDVYKLTNALAEQSAYSFNDIANYPEKKGIKKSRKRIGNAENPIRVFEGIQLVD